MKEHSLIIYLCSSRGLFAISAVTMMNYIKASSQWKEHSCTNMLNMWHDANHCLSPDCNRGQSFSVQAARLGAGQVKHASTRGTDLRKSSRNESHCQKTSVFKRTNVETRGFKETLRVTFLIYALYHHNIKLPSKLQTLLTAGLEMIRPRASD